MHAMFHYPYCQACGNEMENSVAVDRQLGLVLKANPLCCPCCANMNFYADPVLWAAA